MKAGGDISAVEDAVPKWGGGTDVNMSEVLFGGGVGEKELKEGRNTEWEVYVIDDKSTKNAFVVPGGKIFVFVSDFSESSWAFEE